MTRNIAETYKHTRAGRHTTSKRKQTQKTRSDIGTGEERERTQPTFGHRISGQLDNKVSSSWKGKPDSVQQEREEMTENGLQIHYRNAPMDTRCPFSCPPLVSAEDDRRRKWSLKDRRSGPEVPGAEDAHRSYEQKHKRVQQKACGR